MSIDKEGVIELVGEAVPAAGAILDPDSVGCLKRERSRVVLSVRALIDRVLVQPSQS